MFVGWVWDSESTEWLLSLTPCESHRREWRKDHQESWRGSSIKNYFFIGCRVSTSISINDLLSILLVSNG